MTLRICTLLSLLLGCVSTKTLPTPELVEKNVEAPAPTLLERIDGWEGGVSFINAPSEEGASDPMAGVEFSYSRVGSSNSRLSPVDVQIRVEDASGQPLHELDSEQVTAIYRQIYGWDSEAWAAALDGREDAAEVMQTKSNFFWESLAQQVAERVFEEDITAPLWLYGPQCVDAEGVQSCATEGIDAAQRVIVRTTIDGARDPLNPATRTIVYVADRDRLRDPEILLELRIPTGLHVAGPRSEHLDFRPEVAGTREGMQPTRVLVHIPAGTRDRIQGTDYPDYSLIYVPLRHLVFQGAVDDPKGPGSSLSYPDREALQARFEDVITRLRRSDSAASVVSELEPFMTPAYYYMFDDGQGVDGYRDYLLGAHGIGGGISPDVGEVDLVIED